LGGDVVVVVGNQSVSGLSVGDRLIDRVQREQRVAGEVHLGDQPLREFRSEHREVDVGWAPSVAVVPPRIRPWLDRGEAVASVVIGQAAADAGEVGVDRGRVLITLVDVATAGVGLPDLDELTSHRPSVAVDHPAGHHYPFADGFA